MAFTYYTNIPVNYSSDGAQTNYQLKLIIYEGAGSNTTGTVYLNDHSLNWPYDIQFKNNSGTTLDYFRESYTSSSQIVWVECDSIASSGTTNFNLYYGDAGATDTSSGANTFILYDDCSSLSGWTETNAGTGDVSVDTNKFKFVCPSGNANKVALRSNSTVCGATGGVSLSFNLTLQATQDYIFSAYLTPETPSAAGPANDYHGVSNLVSYTGYTPTHELKDGGTSQFSVTDTILSSSTTYKIEIQSKSGSQKWLKDGGVENSQTSTYDLGGSLYVLFYCGAAWDRANDYRLDDIIVRKYTANEPTWATPGSETSTSSFTWIKLGSTYLWVGAMVENASYTKVAFGSTYIVTASMFIEDASGPPMRIESNARLRSKYFIEG